MDDKVLNSIYRWTDDFGGGLVYASSLEEANEKLCNKYADEDHNLKFTIWPWKDDDYFDKDNVCVFDIY